MSTRKDEEQERGLSSYKWCACQRCKESNSQCQCNACKWPELEPDDPEYRTPAPRMTPEEEAEFDRRSEADYAKWGVPYKKVEDPPVVECTRENVWKLDMFEEGSPWKFIIDSNVVFCPEWIENRRKIPGYFGALFNRHFRRLVVFTRTREDVDPVRRALEAYIDNKLGSPYDHTTHPLFWIEKIPVYMTLEKEDDRADE